MLRRRLQVVLREEWLLAILLAILPLLLWLTADPALVRALELHRLVDWDTLAALAGLMVLSRGLEDSGYLFRAGRWLLARAQRTRPRRRAGAVLRRTVRGHHQRRHAVHRGAAHPRPGAAAVIALYLGFARSVLKGVDWVLLAVFALMFIDLGLLAGLPALATLAAGLEQVPGGVLTAGILLSQVISNVPAAIFLAGFTDDWRTLGWAVSVGGFGFAIGSMANLIALRLARAPGLWWTFHCWSMPVLAGGWLLAWLALGRIETGLG